jgi:hypothetical protein
MLPSNIIHITLNLSNLKLEIMIAVELVELRHHLVGCSTKHDLGDLIPNRSSIFIFIMPMTRQTRISNSNRCFYVQFRLPFPADAECLIQKGRMQILQSLLDRQDNAWQLDMVINLSMFTSRSLRSKEARKLLNCNLE